MDGVALSNAMRISDEILAWYPRVAMVSRRGLVGNDVL